MVTGHRPLLSVTYALDPRALPRNVRAPIPDGEKRTIPRLYFQGFDKCVYRIQKFGSDPERRFALLIDDDGQVERWMKPAPGIFQIVYRGSSLYEPDFVVETRSARFLAEVKRHDEVEDRDVLAKGRAAVRWCRHATEFTRTTDGKPWRYLLIPDDEIVANVSFEHLARQFAQ